MRYRYKMDRNSITVKCDSIYTAWNPEFTNLKFDKKATEKKLLLWMSCLMEEMAIK